MATEVDVGRIETPSPLNPLGSKGAGESGTLPAQAAVVSAIEDALAPLGTCACMNSLSARIAYGNSLISNGERTSNQVTFPG